MQPLLIGQGGNNYAPFPYSQVERCRKIYKEAKYSRGNGGNILKNKCV